MYFSPENPREPAFSGYETSEFLDLLLVKAFLISTLGGYCMLAYVSLLWLGGNCSAERGLFVWESLPFLVPSLLYVLSLNVKAVKI